MARHVALLRGVNLGPQRRVPMAALRDVVSGLGYEDVRTVLQSGNVVLTSAAGAEDIARELERAISGEFGIETRVVVRTRAELARVVDRNPLADVAVDPRRYQVTFLDRKLDGSRARELADLDVAPERFVVSGREIYAWHPDGLQRSALARLLSDDKRLGATGTARNWNTVTRLLAAVDE